MGLGLGQNLVPVFETLKETTMIEARVSNLGHQFSTK